MKLVEFLDAGNHVVGSIFLPMAETSMEDHLHAYPGAVAWRADDGTAWRTLREAQLADEAERTAFLRKLARILLAQQNEIRVLKGLQPITMATFREMVASM